MVREIITLNIGGAGVRLGSTIWEQYNLEHGIDYEGNKLISTKDDQNFLQCFYEETSKGKFTPRNLMIDLESNMMNDLQTSKYAQLFHADDLLFLQDGSGGCFSRAYYTVGQDIIDDVNDRLRILFENSDNFQGFIINNAIGGGTGSGLTSLILEKISIDYRKKVKIGYHIYPFNNNYSNNYIETYNALLATHWLLDHTDVSGMFDNHKLQYLCKYKLLIDQLNYFDINILLQNYIINNLSNKIW